MANNLRIKEVTLAQISDSTSAINTVGNAVGNARTSVYQPAVVRVLLHNDDVAAATDVAEDMALFHSKAHGQPWKKDDCQIAHIIQSGTGPAASNATVIYPDFDYTTFE
tara:strand:- start:2315 stop:2641 length:327 start_codon:yes stop_codon:yes gene_type:complete